MYNFKQYAAFGEATLDTLGFTRQGYIGKEKDVENGLGDYGVRKYNYINFNSIDPLWEKYYGWSPYQYCMNNPIWAKDWDGKAIQGALAYPIGVGVSLTVAEAMTAIGVATGATVLIVYGDKIKENINELNSSLTKPLDSRATLNPNAQDATATNINMMDAQQKLDKQMAKQDKKLPSDKVPNNGPKNDESDYFLKAALAKKGIEWTKKIGGKWHDYIKPLKDATTKNVPKDKLRQAAKDFVNEIK